jgi:NitT/TauT family transport system substrate-binding protein
MAWTRTPVLGLALAILLGAACSAPAAAPSKPPGGGPPQSIGGGPPQSIGGAPAAPPAGASAQPLENLRIGYPSRSVTFLAQLLAHDQGYYQQNGLNPELIQMRTNVGLTALMNGEVDYTASFGTNLRSALQGAPIKNIVVGMRAPVFSLVARPEYTAPAQLRGRAVGITNFGGSNDQVTRLMLKHYGLEPQRDVNLIPIGDAPVQYEVMKLGQVDAIVVSLPFPVLAKKEGFQILANAQDLVSLPISGIGTTQTKLETQRDQAVRVVKSEIQALRHVRSHPDDAIALVAELFEMDPATAREVYEFVLPAYSQDGTVEREGVETLVTLELEDGAITTRLPYEQLVDPTIAADAQRALGVTR